MPIAQVVLDLPIESAFDYVIPPAMESRIVVGKRVRVSFGSRLLTGYCIGIIPHSGIKKLKSVKRIIDDRPIIDTIDLNLCREFAAYYGVSLGEAVTSIFRDAQERDLTTAPQSRLSMYCHEIYNGQYTATIEKIIDVDVKNHAKTVICVPDIFYFKRYALLMKKYPRVIVVTRSGLQQTRGAGNVIMIDDDNDSYAQEQTPKYHARILIMMMARHYGFHLHFIGSTPSVDVKALVAEGQIKYHVAAVERRKPMVVDVNIYQSKGVLTPASLAAMESVIKANGKVLVFLNRRGNFALTRCSDCGATVECARCLSAMAYEKNLDQFVCRSCSTVLSAKGLTCQACHKTNFKSVGIGVNQLTTSIQKLFPGVTIGSYQHDDKPQSTPNETIVIATQAILALSGLLEFHVAVIIDIDRELNRMDMRSSFNAWALVEHLRTMSQCVIVQTRQPGQEMLVALARDERQLFYDNEMNVRRELGFAPFGHWLKVMLRGRDANLVHTVANQLYTNILEAARDGVTVHPVAVDAISKLRDQFRYVVLLQGKDVPELVSLVKRAQALMKRHPRLYITLQVD